jgi:hypothetical protein
MPYGQKTGLGHCSEQKLVALRPLDDKFFVVMHDILLQRSAQRRFSKQDQPPTDILL